MIRFLGALVCALVGPLTAAAQSCDAEDRAAVIFTLVEHEVRLGAGTACELRGRVGEVLRGQIPARASVRIPLNCAIDRPSAPGEPVYFATDGLQAADWIEVHLTARREVAYGGRGIVTRFADLDTGPVPYAPCD